MNSSENVIDEPTLKAAAILGITDMKPHKYLKRCSSGNFQWALDWLKKGSKVSRLSWNNKLIFIKLTDTDSFTERDLPKPLPWFGKSNTVSCVLEPYEITTEDILADDWCIVN